MTIITHIAFGEKKTHYHSLIKKGAVFIYPTDTIYGIGCDATNEEAVMRLRGIKQRTTKPFSVIAPSKAWIRETCEIIGDGEAWLEKLPGPFTLIFSIKNMGNIAPSVTRGLMTLGVRIPDHWIASQVEELGVPIVTTSVNFSGFDHMTQLDELDPTVREETDFIVYEGVKKANPSTLMDISNGTAVEVKR